MDDDLLRCLPEDVGHGVITTLAIEPDARLTARVVARQACVVCGLAEASADGNSRNDKYNADIRDYNARNAAKP